MSPRTLHATIEHRVLKLVSETSVDELKRRAHELFMEALDLDEETQATFLTRSCAEDPALRREVEHLLAAVKASTDFLDRPALDQDLFQAPRIDDDAIKGYHIVRHIGSGGMADVYEATQHAPERQVAIKVLRRTLRDTSMLQRFQFEADILAKLNHPGIAQIFETGVCEDGLGGQVPYLVMEYVQDAATIAQYVQRQQLSMPKRLMLFADVCDAVQYGHQMGVVHRDLKPGNLLVDRDGRVRVIDFGVAKVTGPDNERLTVSQERGGIIGTLEYMSPEQCSGDDNVGTASDVYSLGVVLYELVTDTRPYDFSSTSLLAAVQRVQLKVPDRPSERKPGVSKELNAVVMKAMDKEPARRYASAAELAADLHRFLDDRPVSARPPSSLYHLRLFAKRNKALVAALVAVAIALLAGIAGTARMAQVANRARDEAIANERITEQVADFQERRMRRINAQAMGLQIQRELMTAVEAALKADPSVDDAAVDEQIHELRHLLERANLTTVALNTLNDNILQKTLTSVNDQFADQPLVRARLLQSIARTYFELGLLQDAREPLEEVIRLRAEHLGEDDQETLMSRLALADLLSKLGRREEALEMTQAIVDRRLAVLGPDDELTLNARSHLGGILNRLGRWDEAEEIWTDTWQRRRRLFGPDDPSTLMSLNNVGVIHATLGQYDEAEEAWRELVRRRRELLGPNHPTYRSSLSNLGLLLLDRGKLREARAFLEESLESYREELGDDHPETLRAMHGVASLRMSMGDYEGARELLRENYEGRRRVLGPEHPDCLRALVSLGNIEGKCGDLTLAEQLLRQGIEAQSRLLGPEHSDLIISTAALVRVLAEQERLEEANVLLARLRTLGQDRPEPLQATIGQTVAELGAAMLEQGHDVEAVQKLLEGHAMLADAIGVDSEPAREVAAQLVEYYTAQARDPGQDEQVQHWQRAAEGEGGEEGLNDDGREP